MPDKQVFEYAIIRVVPRVEREEFLNVGVIVFVKAKGYLDMQYEMDVSRLSTLFPETDLQEVSSQLETFNKICRGDLSGGPIAALDTPSRFRWLTAKRSTIIQCSAVHPGLCDHADQTLQRLFQEMVGRPANTPSK
jgi:hypothetical protein